MKSVIFFGLSMVFLVACSGGGQKGLPIIAKGSEGDATNNRKTTVSAPDVNQTSGGSDFNSIKNGSNNDKANNNNKAKNKGGPNDKDPKENGLDPLKNPLGDNPPPGTNGEATLESPQCDTTEKVLKEKKLPPQSKATEYPVVVGKDVFCSQKEVMVGVKFDATDRKKSVVGIICSALGFSFEWPSRPKDSYISGRDKTTMIGDRAHGYMVGVESNRSRGDEDQFLKKIYYQTVPNLPAVQTAGEEKIAFATDNRAERAGVAPYMCKDGSVVVGVDFNDGNDSYVTAIYCAPMDPESLPDEYQDAASCEASTDDSPSP